MFYKPLKNLSFTLENLSSSLIPQLLFLPPFPPSVSLFPPLTPISHPDQTVPVPCRNGVCFLLSIFRVLSIVPSYILLSNKKVLNIFLK